MNVYYSDAATKRLHEKMAFIKGKGAQVLSQNIAKALEEGNTYDRLNGRDRYGGTIAKLRSKRKGVYAGKTGPPLAPDGMLSRVISAFRAKARQRGGAWQTVAGWVGVVSAKGFPFLIAHDSGRGRNPRRPIFGLSPRTWARIRALLEDFKNSPQLRKR